MNPSPGNLVTDAAWPHSRIIMVGLALLALPYTVPAQVAPNRPKLA